MSPATAKNRMLAIVEDQPDDSSFDEILRKLALYRMMSRGLADVERGETVTTEELKRRIKAW